MDSKISKRGGKREGAGRPPSGISQTSILVKLDAEIAQLIANESKSSNIKLPVNRNRYINQAIKEKLVKDGILPPKND